MQDKMLSTNILYVNLIQHVFAFPFAVRIN